MFSKTGKAKKSFIGAIAMSLILLMGSALGFLIETSLEQITKPVNGNWVDHASASVTGAGTSSDPYLVYSAADLAYFAKNGVSGTVYIQINSDIDLGEHQWTPISAASYTFVFLNGNNHTISNLNIFAPTTDNVALFANSGYGFRADDLTFSNVNIWGRNYCGALIGNFGHGEGVYNVTITSGTIIGENYVGGIAGYSSSGFYNCTVDVSVKGTGYVGGISGSVGSCTNCIFTGDVTGSTQVGGICGYTQSGQIKNCYVEAAISGNNSLGGISGAYGKISTCGFKGRINVTGSNASKIGSIMGNGSTGAQDRIENDFGIAEIFLNGNTIQAVQNFGAPADLTFTSCYSFSKIYESDKITEYRRYKADSSEATPFSEFAYNEHINGGYPFPRSLFAVGQFIECDTMSYLNEYEFRMVDTPEIKNDGTHYYVELGLYPQTYVGDSLNSSLKNWVTGGPGSGTIYGTYTNDLGTSGNTVTYNMYKYSDNNYYVRVPSAIAMGSGYTFQDGTAVTASEYWFKVEPIKWWVLNYSDVQKGAAPIVVSEKTLTANIPWNKSTSDGNLWSETCNIRTWLNETFYNDAFNGGYKDYIKTTTVKNNSASSTTDGTGKDTNDNVWLLSYNELNNSEYFASSGDKYCLMTDYSIANAGFQQSGNSGTFAGKWSNYWLRTAYTSRTDMAYHLYYNGSGYYTTVSTAYYTVRPALTLNI